LAFCAYCGSHVAQVSFVPCASCGNPTNGAPPRPKVNATNPAALVIGIVAAALLIFAIIGILAAIAIPNLLTATERAKQKRTMADIRSVATALEAYGTDHSEEKAYPDGTTVEDLRKHLQPTYTTNVRAIDAWETGMRYMPLEDHGYVIISAGKDKTFDHESPEQYTGGVTNNFDCDLVFANGSFVQYPDNIGVTTTTGGGQ
jgi:type II secretory pathway pseudopilin PulG